MSRSSSKTLYALLVGINDYQGNVPPLQGCINDVRAMAEFLQLRADGGEFALELQVLTSGDLDHPDEDKPTRRAVLDGFRQHLGQAGEGDVAFFYYSGHGSQERAPTLFWGIEPDHLDETLVLYDSRTDGGWDLADKEISLLIHEIAQKNPQIVVILDACHSGSGTRDASGSRARLAPQDKRERSLDTFLDGFFLTSPVDLAGESTSSEAGWLALPSGRHVVMAACQPEESAREKGMPNGKVHGVLTYCLLDTLQQAGPTLTYRDIFNRVQVLVRSHEKDQMPVMETTRAEDVLLPFLGGAILHQPPYFDVYYDEDVKSWCVRAGAVHGIQAPQGGETTHLAVFLPGAPLEPGTDYENAAGEAVVIKVMGSKSVIFMTMKDRSIPSRQETFHAVVTGTPLLPVAVALEGTDRAALEQARQALEGSLLLRIESQLSQAQLVLKAEVGDGAYRLARAGDLFPLGVNIPEKGSNQAAAEAVVKLEHMGQWLQILALENKHSQLPADAVMMEIFYPDPQSGELVQLPHETGLHLAYNPEANQYSVPVQIRLRHAGKCRQKLFCMLLDLTEAYAVITGEFLFGGGVWLVSGEEVWASNPQSGDRWIHLYIRPELVDQGITEFTDVLKLIVSTDASNAALLAQDALEVTRTRSLSRGLVQDPSQASTLHRLMRRVQTRDSGSIPPGMKISDWRTSQLSLTIECLGGKQMLSAWAPAALGGGVSIQPHPGLSGQAQLVPFQQGKRGLGNQALPALFRGHPGDFQPFDFISSRGGDAGSSVIVLSDLNDPTAVTPQSPLVILADAPLSENEAILPIALDASSGLYLPLGCGWQQGGQVRLVIQHLPAPSSDSRSVGGSVKLFFQKIAIEKFGLQGKTHRLAIAWQDDHGLVQYDDNIGRIQERVKQAHHILLLIHGIFGDTRGMVAGAYTPLQPVAGEMLTQGGESRLCEAYDLILSFDYENINTPIEISASHLKKSLLEAGLAPGKKKKIDLVAHSLGSLVARYWIERDQGARLVRRAVLAGAPNNGSPWSLVEDFAVYTLSTVINGLATFVSGPAVVASLVGTLVGLVKGVESIDTTLDQLKPGSDFYQMLNASEDPQVPYFLLLGNTSILHPAQPDRIGAEQALMARLAEKLVSPKTRNRLLSLVFFNRPNDMAVSLESMRAIPQPRKPLPIFLELPCDHVSYFSSAEGLGALASALTSLTKGR